jgi:hypothetical protein
MLMCLAVLDATLLGEHALEEVGIGQLLPGGFLQQRLQALLALEQAQPL